MNLTVLKGNLTRDPELNTMPSGDSVVNFSIAVNEYYNDKNGQQQKVTDYFDCKAYGPKADTINKFFSKGRPILIEGSLKQERWIDTQTQQNRSKIVIKVKDFEFVDSKNGASETQSDSSSSDKKAFSLADVDGSGDDLEIGNVTV